MTIKSTQAVTRSEVRDALAQGKRVKAIIHYAGKPHEYSETLAEFQSRWQLHDELDQYEYAEAESAQNWRAETQEGIQFV
jgi:hypothetical protein